MQNSSTRRVLDKLIALLDRESQAIRTRDFARLADLTRGKNELAAACEKFLEQAAFGQHSGSIESELRAIQQKAARNAAELQAIKQGFTDARARIDLLQRDEAKTGLYGVQGDEIRPRGKSSRFRDV